MEKSIIKCKCGSELFFESKRAFGWWKILIDGNGNEEDTDFREIQFGPTPKTVRCAECGKRNKNPKGNQ